MPLLKPYSNLDLRPSGVDSLGRLTTYDERTIKHGFYKVYGRQNVNLPLQMLDLALARSKRVRPYDMVITLKSKETPNNARSDDPEDIVGCLIGHLATPKDIKEIQRFSALKPTVRIRTKVNAMMEKYPAVLLITGFVNMSRYANPSMLAFLLRKVQASTFGRIPVMLLWPSTKMDKRLNEQFLHYGFKPYGIGDLSKVSSAIVTDGKCLAMWSNRTVDDRER